MTIIYVVSSGDANPGISGVFSTEDLAQESIEAMSSIVRDDYWIEPWTLDERDTYDTTL